MKTKRQLLALTLILTVFTFIFSSCKKDEHIPPDISLKTGAGYTSGDATVGQGEDILVGITGEKKEDDMISFNVSVAYDGASTTNTIQTTNLSGAGQQHFETDVTFTTRAQAGSEKYFFTIIDKDGNIAQKQLVLTVQ